MCINYFNLLIKAKHSSKSPLTFLRSTFDSCRKWESVAFWGEEGPFKILINVLHIRGRMLTCMKLGGTGAKTAASYLDCTWLFCIVTWETLSEGVSSLCLQPLTFIHTIHPGKLFILDNWSLNCFCCSPEILPHTSNDSETAVIYTTAPPSGHVRRTFFVSPPSVIIKFVEKNTRKKVQLVWAKDNVIFTNVNEKMDNTAQCLQVSTQLTLLCFLKRNQMQ